MKIYVKNQPIEVKIRWWHPDWLKRCKINQAIDKAYADGTEEGLSKKSLDDFGRALWRALWK